MWGWFERNLSCHHGWTAEDGFGSGEDITFKSKNEGGLNEGDQGEGPGPFGVWKKHGGF